jgi:hypothetical protein
MIPQLTIAHHGITAKPMLAANRDCFRLTRISHNPSRSDRAWLRDRGFWEQL